MRKLADSFPFRGFLVHIWEVEGESGYCWNAHREAIELQGHGFSTPESAKGGARSAIEEEVGE